MTESSERAVSVLKPMSGTEETGVGPACCSPHVALRTGHNGSAARMAQHPGAARLSEPELIRKCRMFRDRGVSLSDDRAQAVGVVRSAPLAGLHTTLVHGADG